MKGVMFVERGRAVLREEDAPTCRPGHILCETIYSGISNGTERNVLMGGNYCGGWPGRCGYQNVGRVLEAGEGVRAYKEGELVFSGQFSQHVERFAVDVSASESDRCLVIKLPKSIEPTHAALFGMASVAMHDVRRAEVRLGERALVVGAGGIGQFSAQAARAAGAHVTICDLDEERLAIARELGAHRTVTITDEGSWKQVGSGGQFDVVFEDSGAPVLDTILGGSGGQPLVKSRGKLVIIAGRNDVTYSFNLAQRTELTVFHAGHFERTDLREVCRLAAERVIKVGPIIRDVVPIDDAVRVYERLRDDPNSLLGTVFDWQGS